MQASITFTVLLVLLAGSQAKLSCEECTMEMHKLGGFAKAMEKEIIGFLQEEYCPTVESEDCFHHLEEHYPQILGMVVHEFIEQRAMHMCQLMHACPMKSAAAMIKQDDGFTCDDCTRGLDYIKVYLTDRDVVEEMVVFVQHTFCKPEMEMCGRDIAEHFPEIHLMTMKKFFVPLDICTNAGPCEPQA